MDRPLTGYEIARLAGFLSAARPLHLYQQRALLTEVLRLRAALETAAGVSTGFSCTPPRRHGLPSRCTPRRADSPQASCCGCRR